MWTPGKRYHPSEPRIRITEKSWSTVAKAWRWMIAKGCSVSRFFWCACFDDGGRGQQQDTNLFVPQPLVVVRTALPRLKITMLELRGASLLPALGRSAGCRAFPRQHKFPHWQPWTHPVARVPLDRLPGYFNQRLLFWGCVVGLWVLSSIPKHRKSIKTDLWGKMKIEGLEPRVVHISTWFLYFSLFLAAERFFSCFIACLEHCFWCLGQLKLAAVSFM